MMTITTNENAVISALNRMAVAVSKDSVAVGRETMSLWLNRIAKNTPPFPGNNPDKGNSPAAKKMGENAVETGFRSLFYPTTMKEARNRKAFIDEARIIAFHDSKRGGRGKVKYQKGARKAAHKATLNRAIRAVKKHVGRLKAGWNKAGKYYSAKSGIRFKEAAWVRRHSEPGAASESLLSLRGYNMTATNKVWYASDSKAMKRTIAFTRKVIDKAMEKRMAARLRKRTRQFNKAA